MEVASSVTAIGNRPFDELTRGDEARLEREFSERDFRIVTALAGEALPHHVDRELADGDCFQRLLGGMWTASILKLIIGADMPGEGACVKAQRLNFHEMVRVGDKIAFKATVSDLDPAARTAVLSCEARREDGELVLDGEMDVDPPSQAVTRERSKPPSLFMSTPPDRFATLIKHAEGREPIRTAVVYPVDEPSISGALGSAERGLITPVMIGPAHEIKQVAANAGLNLANCEIIDVASPDAAAEQAAERAAIGEVAALMKGKLHTDDLLEAVMSKRQLRTERRMSHVFAMDVPVYPRLLFISDAAVNIRPTLRHLRDIVQNAIDLARAVGVEEPRVALLSAVEEVTEKIESSMNAAALCKMAERGEIRGGILDGPLAMDNAVSEHAARIKGIESPVAGKADILIVPDLVSGNILAKDLDYLAGAEAAGVVLGAKIPIILTSRADTPGERIASAALASLFAAAQAEGN